MRPLIQSLFRFLLGLFSVTGPFIISFGTFSGLLLFIEIFLGKEPPKSSHMTIYIIYLAHIYLVGVYLNYLTLKAPTKKDQERDTISVTTVQREGFSTFDRNVTGFLTGSFYMLFDWMLEARGIAFVDVFSRPSYWSIYPEEHKEKPIIRMLKNGKSYEIRFPKSNPGKILVREANPTTHNFGEFSTASIFQWPEVFVLAPIQSAKHLIY